LEPHPQEISEEKERVTLNYLESTIQTYPPIQRIKIGEVQKIIRNLKDNKAPGHDLITGKVLKELPQKVVRLITIIYNALIRLNYFPALWKVAQIILIPKPGKKPEEPASYRPLSLLPVLSKVFEKLILIRIKPVLVKTKIIPEHQFGFREQHATTEQIHRVVRKINNALENREYCSAVFLDITQAFDKVWHTGLLYKIKKLLPHNYYLLLKSYLEDRHFLIKLLEGYSELQPISLGVSQGSVLGSLLYLIFTAALPTTEHTMTGTFADDTTILASHKNPKEVSRIFQENITKIQTWLKTWRMKANEKKISACLLH